MEKKLPESMAQMDSFSFITVDVQLIQVLKLIENNNNCEIWSGETGHL